MLKERVLGWILGFPKINHTYGLQAVFNHPPSSILHHPSSIIIIIHLPIIFHSSWDFQKCIIHMAYKQYEDDHSFGTKHGNDKWIMMTSWNSLMHSPTVAEKHPNTLITAKSKMAANSKMVLLLNLATRWRHCCKFKIWPLVLVPILATRFGHWC